MNKRKSNVAVSGLIYRQGKFLLLKRKNSPKIWGPPGGRLYIGEDPIRGLRREIEEETGLKNIKILMPIKVWYGKHDSKKILGITFLCRYVKGKVRLSPEHKEERWMELKEIRKIKVTHDLNIFKLAERIVREKIC